MFCVKLSDLLWQYWAYIYIYNQFTLSRGWYGLGWAQRVTLNVRFNKQSLYIYIYFFLNITYYILHIFVCQSKHTWYVTDVGIRGRAALIIKIVVVLSVHQRTVLAPLKVVRSCVTPPRVRPFVKQIILSWFFLFFFYYYFFIFFKVDYSPKLTRVQKTDNSTYPKANTFALFNVPATRQVKSQTLACISFVPRIISNLEFPLMPMAGGRDRTISCDYI